MINCWLIFRLALSNLWLSGDQRNSNHETLAASGLDAWRGHLILIWMQTRERNSETRAWKIFGIGLSRTGAQTLNDSLEMLGYRSHFVVIDDDLDALLPKFDAFTHFPLVEKFGDLGRRFPGSLPRGCDFGAIWHGF